MIPVPSSVRVWLAVGHTDMRRGMNGLALLVQEALARDPHAGDLYVFRGRRGDLVKILWHDGLGMSLYARRLERGALSGHRLPMAWCPSPAPNWPACWKGSTGGTRSAPIGHWPRAEPREGDCAGKARASLIHFCHDARVGPYASGDGRG
jgi:hypothetical protein